MSENLPAKQEEPGYETCINRRNIRVTVSIGQKALILDYFNTELYEYPEPYNNFDHVYRKPDEEGQSILYFLRSRTELGFDKLYEQLEENHFPKIVLPYPSLADEERIMGFEQENFSKELDRFRQEQADE